MAAPSSDSQKQGFVYQGFGEQAPKPLEESVATLLIRHLPEAIPHETLSRLFSHYGASSIRPCAGGRLRNCCFVDFKDEALASQAQSQLNRLRFLGKVLSVERAGRATSYNKNQQEGQFRKASTCPLEAPISGILIKGGSVPTGEPIASRLGVDYPFPPHLEYAYPPPDGNILTNIVNALIAVPRFYTQVLHLMNKMNIPAPFRMALPTPPLPSLVPAPPPSPPPPPPPIAAKPHPADLSSDESELESSEEDDVDGKKYAGRDSIISVQSRKRAKREAIVGPAVDKGVAHEAVGLKPAPLVPKEIPMIKKKNPVLQIKIAPKPPQSGVTNDDSTIKESNDPAKESLELNVYATPQEIESGKLPPEEILSLPMFKNYTAGDPATVLYIKNLAKDVVVDDFYFIFGSLFGSIEGAQSGLNVKLMQNLVNGYVFKGKPMIIQFGRNPATGKAS
ncbi:RNA-binding (RRM/RBD/RNP motifs) family protein isoform X2 [Tasmannia lanceolata]|uniref:RNA-binding (RRM/RBD/RNP motifs) family protein isoform X2 n=1 Tax=Tasmannia lanceolata TaxID=3420 RepID=UPI004064B360